MKIDDKIIDEKIQYDINREAAKYQRYLQVKLINTNIFQVKKFPNDQIRIIKQAKFTYPPLGKAFAKQTKTIEDQGRKQIGAITDQNERLVDLTNKDNNYKNIFEELVK